jgi:diaminopimelate decarboxylase
MSHSAFHYVDGVLHVEGVSAASLAEQFGTPLYVYSRDALTRAYHAYADACAGRRATVHVAVKANSNLAVLNVFARRAARRRTRCFRASANRRRKCARRSKQA